MCVEVSRYMYQVVHLASVHNLRQGGHISSSEGNLKTLVPHGVPNIKPGPSLQDPEN